MALGFSVSPLDLGQVHGQVVGEPAVPSPEGLGPGGLGIAHDAEPVGKGLEAHDAVVADPEPFPAAGKVEVFGREAQEPGIGVDCLHPLDGAAPES